MVYKWSKVSYSVSADIVGKHFEKLEKKYGEVNRVNVLDSARPEKSPIHSLFEWDDTKAAENYRLTQASMLICNLDIEVQTEDESKPITCRAFVNTSESVTGSFVNIQSAFQNEDTKEIVLQRALQELKAFEKKYENLTELSEIFAEIDQLVDKVG